MTNLEENQYLNLIKACIEKGVNRDDRTGVGCKSIFDYTMKFNLENNNFPLFTTRKTFARGAIEEMLFFIRGNVDSNILLEKGIKIWQGNTTKEFLEARGLNYSEGMIGALYGFQWRNWNGDFNEYLKGNKTGIDQLTNVINLIKNNPNSRRIIMSCWNVEQLDKGVLEPCHPFIQFFVDPYKKTLSAKLTQRSADVMCGVPLNVLGYSFLTIIMAKITGLTPLEFVWSGGDCHIYNNHIETALIQLQREPYKFPTITIPNLETLAEVEKMKFNDIYVWDYEYHSPLKYEMAV